MSIGSTASNAILSIFPTNLSSLFGIQTNMGATTASITNSVFTAGSVSFYPIIGTTSSLSQQLPVSMYFVYVQNITTTGAGQSATVNFLNPMKYTFCEYYDYNNNLSPLVHLFPVYTSGKCTGFYVSAAGAVSGRSYSFVIIGV
jgi:hypothetical protein